MANQARAEKTVPVTKANEEALVAAETAAQAGLDKKAENVSILDVRGLASYADFLVLMSAESDRQVNAIADSVIGPSVWRGRAPGTGSSSTRAMWSCTSFMRSRGPSTTSTASGPMRGASPCRSSLLPLLRFIDLPGCASGSSRSGAIARVCSNQPFRNTWGGFANNSTRSISLS